MFVGCVFRDDNGKNQIYRLIIRCFEVDRLIESNEAGNGNVQVSKASVRYRKTLAQSGAAESLSIE